MTVYVSDRDDVSVTACDTMSLGSLRHYLEDCDIERPCVSKRLCVTVCNMVRMGELCVSMGRGCERRQNE